MFSLLFLPRGRTVPLLINFVKGCTAHNAAWCRSERDLFASRWRICVTWLVRPWDLPQCPAEMDGDQWLMLFWIDPVDSANSLAANLNWLKKFYFHFERQESEQRPGKRAFGRANSAFVFQVAQLIDVCPVPLNHLLDGNKSCLGQHCWAICGHYPMYCTYWW